MTLRTRTLSALGLTFLALTGALPLVTSAILTDRFRSIEDTEARRNISRVEDAIDNELEQLANVTQDWAYWDDTARFLQRRDPDYAATNLSGSTFESLDLNLMAFFDGRGRLAYGRVHDPTDGDTPVPDEMLSALVRILSTRTLATREDLTCAVVTLPDGLWMLAVAPVLSSARTGPAAGALFFGQRLDDARVTAIANLTHLDLHLRPYGEAVQAFGANHVPKLGRVRLGPPAEDRLPAYTALAGLGGKPAALVDVGLDRDTHTVAVQARRYVVGALLLVSALFAMVAAVTVERGVLRGLGTLTDAVSRLGRIGVTGGRLVVKGGDELSTLASRINRMLEDLEVAEAARSRSDRRLALALEAANDGWWDWDILGRSVYYSPRWCTMLGFAPQEIEAMPQAATALVHPEDLPGALARLRTHLRGSAPSFETEVRMRTSTGEWKWLLARGRVVERDAAGRAVRMVGTQTDISERKRMETRLAMSDRMASVGTLAAGVAHEINNPLSYVITNLDVALHALGGRADLADTREALEEAAEGAARVRDIVRDMKLFARDQVEACGVDLRRVLDVATRMTAHEVRNRALLVDEVMEVPLVTGSEARLGQVLVNLIVNAAQAMPEGRPPEQNEIRVRARRSGTSEVVLEVRDNGAGMDIAVQRRIFDPFFTTKPVGVGTGLGLYICHNLVAAFGGRLEVVSVVGEGTTFRVVLPVWKAPASTPTLKLVSRRTRLLIVDDEPAIATAVRRVLGAECEVVVAGDGREAFAILDEDDDFDVVLCDVVMPNLDGPAFYASLAETHSALLSRVVFLSGGAPSPRVQAFLESVPNARLDKPFAIEDLKRVVHLRPTAAA